MSPSTSVAPKPPTRLLVQNLTNMFKNRKKEQSRWILTLLGPGSKAKSYEQPQLHQNHYCRGCCWKSVRVKLRDGANVTKCNINFLWLKDLLINFSKQSSLKRPTLQNYGYSCPNMATIEVGKLLFLDVGLRLQTPQDWDTFITILIQVQLLMLHYWDSLWNLEVAFAILEAAISEKGICSKIAKYWFSD